MVLSVVGYGFVIVGSFFDEGLCIIPLTIIHQEKRELHQASYSRISFLLGIIKTQKNSKLGKMLPVRLFRVKSFLHKIIDMCGINITFTWKRTVW